LGRCGILAAMHRFLPRFTLGSLFGVTALVAIALWWWLPGDAPILAIGAKEVSDTRDIELPNGKTEFYSGPIRNSPTSPTVLRHEDIDRLVHEPQFYRADLWRDGLPAVIDFKASHFNKDRNYWVPLLVPPANSAISPLHTFDFEDSSQEVAWVRGGRRLALCGIPANYDDLWLIWMIPDSAIYVALPRWLIWAIDLVIGTSLAGASIYLLWFRGRRLTAKTTKQESHTEAQSPQSS